MPRFWPQDKVPAPVTLTSVEGSKVLPGRWDLRVKTDVMEWTVVMDEMVLTVTLAGMVLTEPQVKTDWTVVMERMEHGGLQVKAVATGRTGSRDLRVTLAPAVRMDRMDPEALRVVQEWTEEMWTQQWLKHSMTR